MKFAAALAIALLAAGPALAEPSIVGSWFGKGQPFDPNQLWIERYMSGGHFTIRVRICAKDGSVDHLEEGTWTYKNGMQQIVTNTIDGVPEHHTEKYQSLSNDGRTRKYKFLQGDRAPQYTGYVYSADRVPDDFDLPACGPQIS